MSSRGALGAPLQKHRSQNVNSVYSGKNTAASKASGPSKHGGLQALGKTSTIVRRMPKPATLPSLKAEHGQDPQVCLVPQGGQGWSKSTDQTLNAECKGSGTSDVSAVGAPDLRPNWAKQPSAAGGASADAAQQQQAQNAMLSNAQQQQQQAALQQAPSQQQTVTSSNLADATNANTAEYPTLAASAAAAKTSSSVGGGVDASQKGQRGSPLPNQVPDAIVPLPPVPQPQPAGYIGASGPRIADRKLPERYYGGPEVSQRQTGQKYNFLQKMAKLSMDAKEQQSQTNTSMNLSNRLSSGSEKERASSHPGQAGVDQSSSAGQAAGTTTLLLGTSAPTTQTLVGRAEGAGEVVAATAQEDANLHQHQEKHSSSGHQGYRQVQQPQQQLHYGQQQQPPQQQQHLHSQQQKYYNVQQTGPPHQLHHAAPDSSDSSSTTHLGGMMKKAPLLQHPPPHHHHQQPLMGEYTVAGGGMEERAGSHPQQHASSLPPSSHRGGGGNVSAQFENHPLAAGVQQSGHGDIGYSSGHYHRHHGGYDERALSTEGVGNAHHPHPSLGYDYRHAPAAHHHSYDESGVPSQSAPIIGYGGGGASDGTAYRCGEDMTGIGDEHGGYMSGSYDGPKDNKHHHWSGGGGCGDESQSGGACSDGGSLMTQHHQGQQQPPSKYSVRQPLLPQPPAHQMSRYANRPQSQDDSGWYGFDNVQRVSSGGGRRGGGGNGDGSAPPLYSAQPSGGSNVAWYGGGGGGVPNNTPSSNYPPSLLSLDGGVMDAYESGSGGGRFNQSGGSQRCGQMAQQQQQHHGGGSRSRNTASVSSSYGGMDDNSRYVDVTGAQLSSKMKSTRRGGHSATEPSSENDGAYLRDFFDNDPSDNDRQKSFWDRSSNSGGTTLGYATRPNNNNIGTGGSAARGAEQQYKLASKSFDQSQQQQPQFRMLKRNDEKSAEYFAHYATVGTTDGSNGVETTLAESGEEIYSFSHGSGPSTKKKQSQQKSGAAARKTSASGLTTVNGSEEVATDGLTFYNNGAQQRSAHQQPNGKFNRAPGGGKSSAQQQSKDSGSDGAKDADAEASDVVQTAPPADNVWEKRKEEQRQSAERKTQQSKQSRQFDFHFPSMSDAAKFDSTANTEADALPRGNGARNGGRFQDVRFDQPASVYDNNRQQSVGRQSNRQHGYAASDWNPPEPNAESHWDELAASAPTAPLASERRSGSRGNGVDVEPQFGGDVFSGDTNNGGVRREFVNSKNRLGTGKGGLLLSRGARGGTTGVAPTASSGKGGGTKASASGGRERRQPKGSGADGSGGGRSEGQRGSKRAATSPSAEERQRGGDASRKPRGGGSGSEVFTQPAKPKISSELNAKDNFSNMGEFHAEDYKLGVDSAKPNDNGGTKSSRTNGRDAKSSSNRRSGQRRGTSGQNESTTRQRGSGGGRQSRNGGGTSISGGGVFIGRNWRPTQSDSNGTALNIAESTFNGDGGATSEIAGTEQHLSSTDVSFLEDGVLPPPPPLEGGEQTECGSNNNTGGARQQQRALTARNGNGTAATQQQQRRRGASSRTSSNVQSRSGGVSRFMQRHANSKPPRHKDKTSNGQHQAVAANAEQQADAVGQRNHQHLGDRANQLKSPVISDGGAEEWETASESSDFFVERSGRAAVEDEIPQRPSTNDGGGGGGGGQPPLQRVFSERDLKRNVSNNRSSGNNRPDSSSTANGEHLSNGSIAVGQKRSAGQKNVKPASHTFQSSAASATRSSNSSNHKRSSNNVNNAASSVDRSTSEGGAAPSMMKNARDSRKGAGVINSVPFAVRNGLAGVDINDASVVVIDHQPDRPHHRGRSADGGSASDGSGDFEEVLSKRAKRQRLQQLEEERKRAEQERVRQERLAARRAKQLARRAEKQAAAATKKAAALAAKEARKQQQQQEMSTAAAESTATAGTNEFSSKNGDDFAVFSTESQPALQHSFSAASAVMDVTSCGKGSDASNCFGSQPTLVSGGECTPVVSSTTTTAYINGGCHNKSSSISVSTGLDSIAQTSAVWSNTSADNPPEPSANVTFASSNYGTVIPSPIARPVPKNAAATAVETKQYTASEASANFDFTFDASPLKPSDTGSQGVKAAAESSSAKTSQCSLADSGAVKVNCTTSTSITSGVASLLISKPSVSSATSKVVENSDDHAQLQKKLDKVKDFWPAGADVVVNSSAATAPVTGTATATASQQQRPTSFNVAKVKPQQQQQPISNMSSNGGHNGAADPSAFTNSSYTSKIMATNPQSPIASAVFGNALFTLGGLPAAQSAAASQQLGASYSIMLSSGEFVAKSMMAAAPPPLQQHHSTNSPPHFPMGNNGTSRAGSRPNSFFDQSSQQPPHALIVAHNPQQTQQSNTPWSNGGFEFLSGFGATPPPPPMSAPTPCNITVGRSSVPPPPLMPEFHGSSGGPPSLHHPHSHFMPPQKQQRGTETTKNGGILTMPGPPPHFPPPPFAAATMQHPPPSGLGYHHPNGVFTPSTGGIMPPPPIGRSPGAHQQSSQSTAAAASNGGMGMPSMHHHFGAPPPPSHHMPPPPPPGIQFMPPTIDCWSAPPPAMAALNGGGTTTPRNCPSTAIGQQNGNATMAAFFAAAAATRDAAAAPDAGREGASQHQSFSSHNHHHRMNGFGVPSLMTMPPSGTRQPMGTAPFPPSMRFAGGDALLAFNGRVSQQQQYYQQGQPLPQQPSSRNGVAKAMDSRKSEFGSSATGGSGGASQENTISTTKPNGASNRNASGGVTSNDGTAAEKVLAAKLDATVENGGGDDKKLANKMNGGIDAEEPSSVKKPSAVTLSVSGSNNGGGGEYGLFDLNNLKLAASGGGSATAATS